jgi:hypothetical protein
MLHLPGQWGSADGLPQRLGVHAGTRSVEAAVHRFYKQTTVIKNLIVINLSGFFYVTSLPGDAIRG